MPSGVQFSPSGIVDCAETKVAAVARARRVYCILDVERVCLFPVEGRWKVFEKSEC